MPPESAMLLAAEPGLLAWRDEDGSTLLHYAAWKGLVEVAEALLDAGAEVDAESRNGHYGGTPLHAAAHGNQAAVATLLLARAPTRPSATATGGRRWRRPRSTRPGLSRLLASRTG